MPFCVVTGDDSSHSQGQSGKRLLLASRGHPARSPAYQGSCIDLCYLSHTLDLTPDLPLPITHVTTQLLIKDNTCRVLNCTLIEKKQKGKMLIQHAWADGGQDDQHKGFTVEK